MNENETALTDEALAELQRLSDEATPGPWLLEAYTLGLTLNASNGDGLIEADYDGAVPCLGSDADAELIAAMRNAAPSLLRELTIARARLAALEALADRTLTFGGSDLEGWVNLSSIRAALGATA